MITVRIWGGLGNQMFQYAFARALHERTKQSVYIDNANIYRAELEAGRIRDYVLDCYNITLPVIDNAETRYRFLHRSNSLERLLYELAIRRLISPWYYMEGNEGLRQEMMSIKGDAYLQGWFQSELYFKEYRDIICREFTLRDNPVMDEEIKNILDKEDTVSVHIRRGDYKSIDFALPLSYHLKAIDNIRHTLKNPFFLFFSDDVEWVKSNFKMPEKYVFVSGGNYKDYEEMSIMSRCKHNIIANSTFSWWGAWLNNNPEKVVIAPRSWMRLKDPLSIIPKEWVII